MRVVKRHDKRAKREVERQNRLRPRRLRPVVHGHACYTLFSDLYVNQIY